MISSGYLPAQKVERLLQRYPSYLVDIALELRGMVVHQAPYATERALRHGLGYHNQAKGGPVSAGICLIEIRRDHVRLAFIHGAFLKDPGHLLQGKARYKKYVRLTSYEGTPWRALKELIKASAAFDPRLPRSES
jgi:hypothetical protein